jgi:hypothetical protein
MSDINSGLPVRTQLPGQANYDDVVVRVADGTTASQLLAIDSTGRVTVKLDDGAGNAITSQVNGAQRALDVGINVAGVQIDPRQIRALTAADVVSVVQSTSPWIVSDTSDGSPTGGTAGTTSQLAGGIFHTVAPTLTNGQQAGLQLTSAGALIVSATLGYDTNYSTVGANTLRAAAQIGNATGAADFNAGATGAQTLRVVANQGAPNTNANAWFTQITDGTHNATVTAGGALNVTVASALPAGTNSIGTVVVSNFPTTVDTNYGTVGANTIRTASQIGNATGAANFGNGATGAQTLRVAANLAVAGADVSGTNPVPVSFSSAPLGTPVNNYNTVAAVAAAATSNHIYTITSAKTFQGKKIWASASGLMKIEVRVSPDGSTYSTLWVGFNSTADANITIDLDQMVFIESGAGATIEVIRTNMDKKSMDVYSTISGTEV